MKPMDNERKVEIGVGITVTAALLILVLGVLWGKGSNLFLKRTECTVRFQDVRGLEKGDPVFIRGIELGEVNRIAIRQDFAEVRLRIKNEVPLFSDTQIFIEDKDMMGDKQVTVFPGNSQTPLNPGQVINGNVRINMLDILMGAEQLIRQTQDVLIKVNSVMNGGKVDRTIHNIEKTTSEANRLLAENRQSFRSIVKEMEGITRQFREDSTAARFGSIASRLDSTLVLMNRFVTEAGQADGTMGRLIRDKKLYDHLVKTTVDLDSLIADVKQNPKRYIHVTVF